MAAYQYVYHMSGVSKTYPGGKKTFENIHLNFLPGVKIGGTFSVPEMPTGKIVAWDFMAI